MLKQGFFIYPLYKLSSFYFVCSGGLFLHKDYAKWNKHFSRLA